MDAALSQRFNPYHKWLGIRDCPTPPNHYRLLGLELWESDEEVIRDAASRQIQHVRSFRNGPHRDACQEILDQLNEARETLLSPMLRKAYDRHLRLSADGDGDRGSTAPLGVSGAIGTARIACEACGAENAAMRQFCSACGARLWEPCIACGVPNRPGELHCGACGVNFAVAAQEQIDQIQSSVQQAQALRAQLRYEQAIEILEHCTIREHPRLEQCRGHALRVLDELTAQCRSLKDLQQAVVPEARRLMADCDYEGAAKSLEQVPLPFRTDVIRELLADAQSKQAEVQSLVGEVQLAVREKNFDGLLAKAERLLALKPGDPQVQHLVERLRPREAQLLKARNDRLCKLAADELKRHNYNEAVALLNEIDQGDRTAEATRWLEEATARADEVAWLAADLRGAVIYDEHLLPIAERLLKLRPNDQNVQSMVAQVRRLSEMPKAARPKQLPAAAKRSGAGHAISRIERFERIALPPAETPPAIDWGDYCVAAGLALQLLQKGSLATNLLPDAKGGLLKRLTQRKRTATAAWGIDIGRHRIKAIKLSGESDQDRVTVEAVECVPLARDAAGEDAPDPIAAALDTFLSRNELKHCAVGVSLPGEKLLMRFFTVPLADKKKVAEIMHYEVKQQIPLPLETVSWDYQLLETPQADTEDHGIAEHAIALFAGKAEDIQSHIRPLLDRNVRVDLVQAECAALHNFLAYEYLAAPAPAGGPITEKESVWALLDIGSEASNLVVTNGHAMWMRCLPLGGNQFTRALAKQFNLTWEKAERLKRSPTRTPLMHRTYAAMEPHMQSLAGEVHRWIDQFVTQDRRRVLEQLLVAGGGIKLHGLCRYLRAAP